MGEEEGKGRGDGGKETFFFDRFPSIQLTGEMSTTPK